VGGFVCFEGVVSIWENVDFPPCAPLLNPNCISSHNRGDYHRITPKDTISLDYMCTWESSGIKGEFLSAQNLEFVPLFIVTRDL